MNPTLTKCEACQQKLDPFVDADDDGDDDGDGDGDGRRIKSFMAQPPGKQFV